MNRPQDCTGLRGRALVLGAILAFWLGPLWAAPEGMEEGTYGRSDAFHWLVPLSREELAQIRGGFVFGGWELEFGANLRTLIDGRLALESLIRFGEAGIISEQTTVHSPPAVPAAVAELMPQLGLPVDVPAQAQGTPGRPTNQPSSNATATAAPRSAPLQATTNTATPTAPAPTATATTVTPVGEGSGALSISDLATLGLDVPGLEGSKGVLIEDHRGATLALHDVLRDRIASFVISRASGQDVRQELNIDVTIKNFKAQQEVLRSAIIGNINSRLAGLRAN